MTFEEFNKRRIDFLAVMTKEDRRKLGEVLKSPILLQALAWTMLRKEELAGQIAEIDLSNQVGISKALRLQGEVLGVHNAVERLFAASEIEDGTE
jgi:hypothetical protein